MLKNVFYKGLILYNGVIYQGVHEPIVDEKLFDKVQEAFKKDGKSQYVKDNEFEFANLMKCSDCGCSIVAEIKKGKYIYYHCSWGKGKKNCSNKTYTRQEDLEKQFENTVIKVDMGPQQREWLIDSLKVSFREEQKYHKERIESLTKQAESLRERLDKIYIDKLDGKIDEEFWLTKHNEWKSQLIRIKSILDSHDETHDRFIQEGLKIIELASNAHDRYIQGTSKEKAKFLKLLLSNCSLNGGKIDYEYRKPFDIFAKGLNSVKDWILQS